MSLDLLVAGHGVLELTHPGAERATDLRQTLGPEQEKCEEQQKNDLHGADVWHGGHRSSVPPKGRKAKRVQIGVSRGPLAALGRAEAATIRGACPRSGMRPVAGTSRRSSGGIARTEEPARRARGRHRDRQGRRPRGRHEQVHAIMGPNGSGKSTLAYAIAGHPAYEITEGQILLDGEDITEAGADERAQKGLFLAFQYPHAIPGVTVQSFLRTAINAVRKARNGGVDDPIPVKEFLVELLRGDGPAEGLARARLALPERRLLGRREEARRDPADGDAEAAHRRARRDRLGPRHRRAEDRRGRGEGARRARRWARS